jgi:hypothetical protein
MTSLDFGHSSCKMGMELWFLDILTREKEAAIWLSPGQMRGCLDSQLPDQASTDQTYVVSLSHRDLQERGRSVLHICRACPACPAWGFEGLGRWIMLNLRLRQRNSCFRGLLIRRPSTSHSDQVWRDALKTGVGRCVQNRFCLVVSPCFTFIYRIIWVCIVKL